MLGLSSLDVEDDSDIYLCMACSEDEDESDSVRVRGEWVQADPRDLDVCMFEGVHVSEPT